ncbi:AcrR family transcriptional regulator [Kitasatospora sp. GAS204B]|nr:AcrR family transcriptional regulator [Kitasatospora sp. GAS204B]
MLTPMTRFRETVRSLLRERLLDAAYDLVSADGWSGLRMAAAASAAGVSRQTVYTEFGSKDALGQALILREAERFLLGVQEQLDAHREDLESAAHAAISYALRHAADNPLVKAIVSVEHRGDRDLLDHLTTRPEPLLDTAATMLDAYLAQAWPAMDAHSRSLAADTAIRLTISHIVQGTPAPEQAAARTAQVITRVAQLSR